MKRIWRRVRNLWRLSGYEPVNTLEPIEVSDGQILKHFVKPTKKAVIIKKLNKIDEFIKS